MEQNDDKHNQDSGVETGSKHRLFRLLEGMQPQRSEQIRHDALHLLVGELSLDPIDEAVPVGDLGENDDAVEHEDEEPEDWTAKQKPGNGSRLKQAMPEGQRLVSLVIGPSRGLVPNPIRNGFHCLSARSENGRIYT